MKRTQYTAEFKAEAVKQIIETGHPAPEVSSRLRACGSPLYLGPQTQKGRWETNRRYQSATGWDDQTQSGAQAYYRRARYSKKGHRVLCQSGRVKYAFIKEHRSEFRLSSMCRVLKVHRSGYYAWLKDPQSPRALENAKLSAQIRYYYDQSIGIYGSPRIYHDLKEAGISCSENRVARLMRDSQLRSIRGYKRPTLPSGSARFSLPQLIAASIYP